MARVFGGEHTFLLPALGPLERLMYRLTAVNQAIEQGWKNLALVVANRAQGER
jgi:potassium-transporting ATPase potassium-binding subunit